MLPLANSRPIWVRAPPFSTISCRTAHPKRNKSIATLTSTPAETTMVCTLIYGSSTHKTEVPEGGIARYELLEKATAAFSLAPGATLRPQPTCALRVLEKKELAHDARVVRPET